MDVDNFEFHIWFFWIWRKSNAIELGEHMWSVELYGNALLFLITTQTVVFRGLLIAKSGWSRTLARSVVTWLLRPPRSISSIVQGVCCWAFISWKKSFCFCRCVSLKRVSTYAFLLFFKVEEWWIICNRSREMLRKGCITSSHPRHARKHVCMYCTDLWKCCSLRYCIFLPFLLPELWKPIILQY